MVLTLDVASLAKSRQIFSLHDFTLRLSRPAVTWQPKAGSEGKLKDRHLNVFFLNVMSPKLWLFCFKELKWNYRCIYCEVLIQVNSSHSQL